MSKQDGLRLGMFIDYKTTGTDYYDDNTSINFDFSFVTVSAIDEIKNVANHFSDEPYGHLADIQIQARLYTGKYNKADSTYNHYENVYYNGYHPEVREMEKAIVAMKKIHKGLDAMKAKRGYPVDFADFVGRVAEVTGIDCFVEKVSGRGTFYNDNQHRFLTIGEGINTLRHIVRNDEVFNKGIANALQRAA